MADLALAFLGNDALALADAARPTCSGCRSPPRTWCRTAMASNRRRTSMRCGASTCSCRCSSNRSVPKGSVVLALSSDHGVSVVRRRSGAQPGLSRGRLLTSDRAYPSFLERLNRLVALELFLDPQSRVLFGSDGLHRLQPPGLSVHDVGECAADRGDPVRTKDVDRVLPGVMTRSSARKWWRPCTCLGARGVAEDAPATEFVRNDFRSERSGDAIFVPRYGVMTHWDPARGAMHGTHYTTTPTCPCSSGGRRSARDRDGRRDALRPGATLGAILGVRLPQRRRARPAGSLTRAYPVRAQDPPPLNSAVPNDPCLSLLHRKDPWSSLFDGFERIHSPSQGSSCVCTSGIT